MWRLLYHLHISNDAAFPPPQHPSSGGGERGALPAPPPPGAPSPRVSRAPLPHASGQSHPYGNSLINGRAVMKWRHQGVGRGRKSGNRNEWSCPETEGSGKKDRLCAVCCQGRNYTFTLAFS